MKSHCYKITFGKTRSRITVVTIATSEALAIEKVVTAYGRSLEPLDTDNVEVVTDPNDIIRIYD